MAPEHTRGLRGAVLKLALANPINASPTLKQNVSHLSTRAFTHQVYLLRGVRLSNFCWGNNRCGRRQYRCRTIWRPDLGAVGPERAFDYLPV